MKGCVNAETRKGPFYKAFAGSVLLPRRMRIRLANLRNVARLAHRRKVLRREVVRTGKPEHAANLDRPPWPFGENRKNVVRHPPASALR